jgi:hypothetical protein
VTAPPDHEFDRRPHGCKIGSNIDRIGDEQQPDQDQNERLGEDISHILRQAAASHAADLRADKLNGSHQRIGQDHRPEQIKAELGSRLGICGNSTWIIVSSPGHEARAELAQKMLLCVVVLEIC